MNAFLSVSRGSGEPPVFLELMYRGKGLSDEKPLAIVGELLHFDNSIHITELFFSLISKSLLKIKG